MFGHSQVVCTFCNNCDVVFGFQDESRMKTICVEAAPINIQTFNKKLIEEIENMLTG